MDEPPLTFDIRELRSKLNLSQCKFAARFGFRLSTVQNWERGARSPNGAACILLAVIAKSPDVVAAVVSEMGLTT
jgi:putative transcriptional regulator